MFFRTQSKIDPQTKEMYIYYRLVESYRDVMGDTRSRTVLSVGRMEGIKPQQLWAIADGLNARYRCEPFLFSEESPVRNICQFLSYLSFAILSMFFDFFHSLCY